MAFLSGVRVHDDPLGTEATEHGHPVGSALNFNMICYCNNTLRTYDGPMNRREWFCHSCFQRKKERVNYWCNRGKECVFNEITSDPYIVCSECFFAPMNDNMMQNELDSATKYPINPKTESFRFDKLEWTLNQIG